MNLYYSLSQVGCEPRHNNAVDNGTDGYILATAGN